MLNLSLVADQLLSIVHDQSESLTTFEQQYADQLLEIAIDCFNEDPKLWLKQYRLNIQKTVKDMSANQFDSASNWAKEPTSPSGVAMFSRTISLVAGMIKDGKLEKDTQAIDAAGERREKREANAARSEERASKVDADAKEADALQVRSEEHQKLDAYIIAYTSEHGEAKASVLIRCMVEAAISLNTAKPAKKKKAA